MIRVGLFRPFYMFPNPGCALVNYRLNALHENTASPRKEAVVQNHAFQIPEKE